MYEEFKAEVKEASEKLDPLSRFIVGEVAHHREIRWIDIDDFFKYTHPYGVRKQAIYLIRRRVLAVRDDGQELTVVVCFPHLWLP